MFPDAGQVSLIYAWVERSDLAGKDLQIEMCSWALLPTPATQWTSIIW
jgi:hypothetical protein